MKKFKYLVTDTKDLQWGLNVDTVGYEENLPGEDYPTHGHADGFGHCDQRRYPPTG